MRSVTSFLFLATVFCCTFEKIHWNIAGAVGIADVFAILFLLSFAIVSRPRLPLTSAIVLAFFAAFLAVYLAGYFNLETHDALAQFAKGFVKFVIHFSFLAAGVAWLARRGRPYYWRTLAWFIGGMATNAAYGVLQLLAARSGHNLDATLLSPLTGGASQINIYGAVEGAKVYRPNAITGDPNHLGIMLIVPLLVLVPLYLRLERGHRLRGPARAPDRVPAPGRDLDAVAERPARARGRRDRARDPVQPLRADARVPLPARGRARGARRDRAHPPPLLRGRVPLAASRRAAARSPPTSRSTASSRRSSTRTRCSGSG